MANINLLPWREALREERNKSFYVFIGLVVTLALVSVFAVLQYFDSAASSQSARNSYLQRETALLMRKLLKFKSFEKLAQS